MKKLLFLLSLFLLSLSASAADVSPARPISAVPQQEALRLGEKIYREGLLPSGDPVQAVVQGDIPVDGTMFSCESCHLRSGMGSWEGTVVVLPTNAAELYRPFTMVAPENIPSWEEMPSLIDGGIRRPAYTDETLAQAIWNGIDPSGRSFDPVMPRYLLDPEDMELLVLYLKNLSAVPSPGASATTIHFATVVSKDLPAPQREAMLSTLQGYFDTHNGETRREFRRAKEVLISDREMYAFYRKFQLHVWEVQGPPESWGGQLERYYREEPVFALIGGMVTGGWEPVHAFCERNRIPCLFPVTELPVISDSDWYTLYFSKGHYQQGEGIARFLRSEANGAPPGPVVQVFRDDPAGRALARGFEENWREFGYPPPENLVLGAEDQVESALQQLGSSVGEATVLLWLGPEVFPTLEAWSSDPPPRVFLAASLLEGQVTALPESARSFTLVAYPYRLPEESKKINQVVRSWLKVRKIPELDLGVQARVYAAFWQLSNSLMMMKTDFYRDYLLDVFDMMNDQTYSVATFPRLSFGQGQRYAAKGCYIVQVGPGSAPRLVPRTEWVIH